jgi:hypothetical protein
MKVPVKIARLQSDQAKSPFSAVAFRHDVRIGSATDFRAAPAAHFFDISSQTVIRDPYRAHCGNLEGARVDKATARNV